MVKRAAFILLALLMISATSYAQETQTSQLPDARVNEIDVASMSTEALLETKQSIEQELAARGYVAYFDLEPNSKGESVSALQERLSELGYYSGNLTGRYDSATRQAVKQFQKANGLDNNGVASQSDQQLLFSAAALPKATPMPRATTRPKPTDVPFAGFDAYGVFDYEDTMRYPENHKGEKVVLNGRVVQVIGEKSRGFEIRLSTSGTSSDIVYIYIDKLDYNILEGDRMTIYACINGTITYQALLGQSITIPSAHADYVILK